MPKPPAIARNAPTPPVPVTRHTITAPSAGTPIKLRDAWQMPLNKLRANPWQPRQHADTRLLKELIDDIQTRGILQPLVVRLVANDLYEVVAGERRYRAATALHLETVPVIVQNLTDAEARAASIRENLHREAMDPEDEGRYYQSLQDSGVSLREIGAAIGKSYEYVRRRIKLVETPGALEAYRAGLANLDELAGNWEVPDPQLLADVAPGASGGIATESYNAYPRVDALAAAVTERDSESAAVARDFVTERDSEQASAARDFVTERDSSTPSMGGFRRRPAIYKPFHTLTMHVTRLAPANLDREERRELRSTIQTLRARLDLLEAELNDDAAQK